MVRIATGRVRGSQKERFLLVCYADLNGAAAVYDNIALWQKLSQFSIDVVNLWPGTGAPLFIPPSVDLSDYDGVIIHATTSYNPQNLSGIDRMLKFSLSEYDGLKVLMKQDEQYRAGEWSQIVASKKFDLVLTCLPESEWEKVYPRNVIGPDVRLLNVLTGYVPDALRTRSVKPLAERRLDIGYRGSIQPLSFGRLGFEKRQIGRDVGSAAARMSLRTDISSRWEDRLGGDRWQNFLGECQIILGAESGSNLFDFNGEVEAKCNAYAQIFRDEDPGSEEYYYRAHELFLNKYEGNVFYAQIAPRHFEAAAAGAVQMMYEGQYSGIFLADRHYIPIKKDGSNLGEALEKIKDERLLSRMAECALDEIVRNDVYTYRHFVSTVDDAIRQGMESKNIGRGSARSVTAVTKASPSTRRCVLVMMAHEPTIDPRVEWFAASLAKQFDVCELGTYGFNFRGDGPTSERIDEHRVRVRVERSRHDWAWCDRQFYLRNDGFSPERLLADLTLLMQAPSNLINQAIGPAVSEESIERFREYCRYFVNTNSALLQAAFNIGTVDAVAAVDLESLPAAVAYARRIGAPLIFDAHEYWPFSVDGFESWECEFWSSVEQALVSHVDICATVTPQLAELMSARYGRPFATVPNCVPSSDAASVVPRYQKNIQRSEVQFLFQGNFAVGRGLEELVRAWKDVNPKYKLWLRGPENGYRKKVMEIAAQTGVLQSTVFFPDSVKESELIEKASWADVGVVPYQPGSVNNMYCSPNKLSQYMAAGVPILANSGLDFVKQRIDAADCGVSVSFTNDKDIVAGVHRLGESPELRHAMGERGRSYYLNSYNWEAVSAEFVKSITDRMENMPPRGTRFNLDWVARGKELRSFAALTPAPVVMHQDAVLAPLERREFERIRQLVSELKTMRGFAKHSLAWIHRRLAHRI